MIDNDTTRHNRRREYSGRRNYLAWRTGAVVCIGLALGTSAKIASDNFPDMTGEPTPVIKAGDPNTETLVVQPGENAWKIAKQRSASNTDIRPLVRSIMSQPDAVDGLQPGDELIVPIAEDQAPNVTTTTRA